MKRTRQGCATGVVSAVQLVGMMPNTNSPLRSSERANEMGRNPVESCSSGGSAWCEQWSPPPKTPA